MAQSQQTSSTLTFCIFQWIKTLVEKTKNWPFMQGDIQLNYTTLGEKTPQKLSSKTILVETLLAWDTCVINKLINNWFTEYNRATIHWADEVCMLCWQLLKYHFRSLMFYIYLYYHTSSKLFKSPDLSLAFLPNKFISNYLESVIYQSVSAKVLHSENKIWPEKSPPFWQLVVTFLPLVCGLRESTLFSKCKNNCTLFCFMSPRNSFLVMCWHHSKRQGLP